MKVDEDSKNDREATTRDSGKLCEDRDRVELERYRLQAKQLLAQLERGTCFRAVHSLQSGVGHQQKCVAKDLSASQKWVEDHRACMCHHLSSLLAECVLDARISQSGNAVEVVGLYAEI